MALIIEGKEISGRLQYFHLQAAGFLFSDIVEAVLQSIHSFHLRTKPMCGQWRFADVSNNYLPFAAFNFRF